MDCFGCGFSDGGCVGEGDCIGGGGYGADGGGEAEAGAGLGDVLFAVAGWEPGWVGIVTLCGGDGDGGAGRLVGREGDGDGRVDLGDDLGDVAGFGHGGYDSWGDGCFERGNRKAEEVTAEVGGGRLGTEEVEKRVIGRAGPEATGCRAREKGCGLQEEDATSGFGQHVEGVAWNDMIKRTNGRLRGKLKIKKKNKRTAKRHNVLRLPLPLIP